MNVLVEKSCRMALRAGERLRSDAFHDLRRRMMLEFCKWDSQISDVTTLADFPLFLQQNEWKRLAVLAEKSASELVAAELEVLRKPHLQKQLGLPRQLLRVLRKATDHTVSPTACRVMRFDFHFTTEGWRISEVNSDVPGGFTEASNFTRLMAAHVGGIMPGDAAAAWTNAIVQSAEPGPIALLFAPGYLEDLQIMAHLRNRLCECGVEAHLARPEQLSFRDGFAHLESVSPSEPLGAVVKFFQTEWLAGLPRKHWEQLLVGGKTPMTNPAGAILTESKRFALLADQLESPLTTWLSILPETRDPRNAPWKTSGDWIIKAAYCNTGDLIGMRDILPTKQWRSMSRAAFWHPNHWIAQRRFDVVAVDSPAGPIFPCIGVYTIDGKAAGIYGRFSAKRMIDYAAVDVAVLLESDDDSTKDI
jgi:hypothetical protein